MPAVIIEPAFQYALERSNAIPYSDSEIRLLRQFVGWYLEAVRKMDEEECDDELQACECCKKTFWLELMSCVGDDGWFCPECVAHFQRKERRAESPTGAQE